MLVAGLLGLIAVGALAGSVPVRFLPNLSLLGTVAAGLVLGPAAGLLVAASLGLTADVMTGTLVGQQAMLRVLELAVLRGFASQLDLRRGIPLSVFVAALSLADAGLLVLQSRFFLGLSFHWSEVGGVLLRAGVNGLVAPLIGGVARWIADALDESEARREMRLDTKRPVL